MDHDPCVHTACLALRQHELMQTCKSAVADVQVVQDALTTCNEVQDASTLALNDTCMSHCS